jgi:hypothetical protein
MNNDIEHLRLLTIGHYIAAGITALFACFPLIHLSIGLVFLLNPPQTPEGEAFPSQMFGMLFALLGGALVIVGWTFAGLIFAAGRSIKARKRRTFCIVVAAISCASFPFGTVLGVLSILVLSRPTVKEMFNPQPALDYPPPVAPQPGAWRDETFDKTQ